MWIRGEGEAWRGGVRREEGAGPPGWAGWPLCLARPGLFRSTRTVPGTVLLDENCPGDRPHRAGSLGSLFPRAEARGNSEGPVDARVAGPARGPATVSHMGFRR